MNLYLTADGRYVGTQAEAKKSGKGWTPEIVPTDKEGLINYLNERCGSTVVASWKLASEPPPSFSQQLYADDGPPIVPMIEQAPPTPKEVLGTDDLSMYIMSLDGWRLGNVLSAALDRAAQIKKEISR